MPVTAIYAVPVVPQPPTHTPSANSVFNKQRFTRRPEESKHASRFINVPFVLEFGIWIVITPVVAALRSGVVAGSTVLRKENQKSLNKYVDSINRVGSMNFGPGVDVGDGVGDCVAVAVGVEVRVDVGVGVGERVTAGAVGVTPTVAVAVIVGVTVIVGVGVTVIVGVGVVVFVGVITGTLN